MTCGQLSLLLQADDEPIWVLDTSALIAFKYLISGPEQWQAFERLTVLVDEARIAMPRQVLNEVAEVAHPDVPGVWAPGMRDRLRHPLDAAFEYVQRVMREAGERSGGGEHERRGRSVCNRLGSSAKCDRTADGGRDGGQDRPQTNFASLSRLHVKCSKSSGQTL